MSTLTTPDSLKMVREALCIAQTALPSNRADPRAELRASDAIQRLIEDIDRQRPLGPDGKHGDRHTSTCGCEVPELRPGDPVRIIEHGQVVLAGVVGSVDPDGLVTLRSAAEVDVVTLRTGDGTAHEVRS